MSLQPEEITILEKVINIRNRLTALKQNRAEYIKSQDVLSIYQAVVKQVEKLNDLRDQETGPHVPNRLDTLLADVFSLLSLFFLTIGKARECPATYSQIASMRQLLDHMNESAVYTEGDLKSFRNRLDELRDIVRNDKESGLHPPAMTKLLDRKLNECDAILSDLQDSLSVLSIELVPIHQRLVTLRRQLVALAAKPKPFKADLKPIMEDLRKIESKRENGKFLGPNGVVPASQALCSGLLEECFDIAQEIRAREDDVSTALKPIHDRLWDMRAQLEQLVLTHRWTLRETDLWNYSQALQEIDKMRVNGKFVDAEGNVPNGQYVSAIDVPSTHFAYVLNKGSIVPSAKMLRPDPPTALRKRTGLGGINANRQQVVNSQEMPQRGAEIRRSIQPTRPIPISISFIPNRLDAKRWEIHRYVGSQDPI
ncbi:unnamed protein product [Rhizoctonia solani]|uniref:Uncharacterized protein n=1 Tax=Rhizoctonia solani TaxID=456999 RepID=A0A8H3BDX8_9AGAM|nr:unnamed protein product [Rhizoctonia solani]